MKQVAFVSALVLMAGAAVAQDISTVNSVMVQDRVWNDFPGSTLVTTNAYPGSVRWEEQFAVGEPGNFANKHMAWFSNDGGASAFEMFVGQSWTIEFDIRISAPGLLPRKEGGLQLNNPRFGGAWIDEGRVLVATNDWGNPGGPGEVAVFGGAMPFHSFGGVYTTGTTAHLSFSYIAPGVLGPEGAYRLIFTDAVTGVHDSGNKIWGVEPDGTVGFNNGSKAAMVAQNTRNPIIADSSDIEYSNIHVIPAPGAALMLGLAGLAAGRRRR